VSGRLLVLAPLGIEARAFAGRARQSRVERVGMGPVRAARAADRLRAEFDEPASGDTVTAIAVVGLGGGLVPDLVPGDVVVADRVLRPDGSVVGELGSAALIAGALRRAGLVVRVGSVVSTDHIVKGDAARGALAELGATVVDMESAALLDRPWGRPTAIVRAISDAPGQDLISPRTLVNVAKALKALRVAGPVLETWADSAAARTVVLASPRSFCAGVERAIHTVEAAIERFGTPVYVRRQIVHNDHVVSDLEQKGAVFVRELDEVPEGSTVVFSAHGVGQAVRADAAAKRLHVVDATCPLVAKVHNEVKRFARDDHDVVLIGHAGHDEVEGTMGEVPGIVLVETPDDVAKLELEPTARVAFATQTTLAPDEVEATVAALRHRFANLTGPRSSDICYATHNRQEAVRAIAADCDLILVVGSATSSNSHRLVEVARRAGCRSQLIGDESDLRPEWLVGTPRIGLTAGASAPDFLVRRVVDALSSLGPLVVDTRSVHRETVSFSLPLEVR
jgi:4-hydroxy-3-methylbut-2-enyl diphosphate reductase